MPILQVDTNDGDVRPSLRNCSGDSDYARYAAHNLESVSDSFERLPDQTTVHEVRLSNDNPDRLSHLYWISEHTTTGGDVTGIIFQ